MSSNLILLILIGLIAIALIVTFHFIYWQDVTQSPNYPFAYLPEMSLSEQPTFLANNLINNIIGKPPIIPNQNMIEGTYQRYPLNTKITPTSIVAVEPGQNYYPWLTAWGIEVDIDAWNFVWCDSGSSYFVTPVNVLTNPIVCIKGEYPNARYFSYYTYTGLSDSDNGTNLFGQGITLDGQNLCNPSIAGNCAGFVDYQIIPDAGSKNPFTDPTYVDTDPRYFTLWFISPYYTGPKPDPRYNFNILPLTLYGATNALICYRIYSPFNPKTCESGYFWGQNAFDTRGCPNPNNPAFIDTPYGGAANPDLESTTVCENGDKVCYAQCIAHKMAYTKVPECAQFVGNNTYCVCEHPTNPCYEEYNKIIQECTNRKGSIKSFCANAPQKEVGMCFSPNQCEIAYPSEKDKLSKGYENCLQYTLASQIQMCAINKLQANPDPTCYPFKDSFHTCEICEENSVESGLFDPVTGQAIRKKGLFVYSSNPDGTVNIQLGKNPIFGKCFSQFSQQMSDCAKKVTPVHPNDPSDPTVQIHNFGAIPWCAAKCPENNDVVIPGKVEPMYGYQPIYDLLVPPIPCCDSSSGTPKPTSTPITRNKNRYDCRNGYCFPSPDGKYVSPDCNNECAYPENSESDCTTKKPLKTPTPSSIKKLLKENFENSTSPPCATKYNSDECNPFNQAWQDIGTYGFNSYPASKMFRCGWVELPQVFFKYTYNNYFIKLPNWNYTKQWKLSLYHYLSPFMKYLQLGAPVNPNVTLSPKGDSLENFEFLDFGSTKNIENQAQECFAQYKDDYLAFTACMEKINNNKMSETITQCINSLGPDASVSKLESCIHKEEEEDVKTTNNLCPKYVDPQTYFNIGAQWPVGGKIQKVLKTTLGVLKKDPSNNTVYDVSGNPISYGYDSSGIPFVIPSDNKTFIKDSKLSPTTEKKAAPFCGYYLDLCKCQNKEKNANDCCESSPGRLDCQGKVCFTQWKLPHDCTVEFTGDALPFQYSANTGGVIPFPNPDSSYIGCCTSYDEDYVYVVWMDCPTYPSTPGFSNISSGNNYDVRYFSLGHYFYNMTKTNMKPVQSDLVDAQIRTYSFTYTDVYTKKCVTAHRACIVLATLKQYEYFKSFDLWHDHVNWLNWGPVRVMPKPETLLPGLFGYRKANAPGEIGQQGDYTPIPNPTFSPFTTRIKDSIPNIGDRKTSVSSSIFTTPIKGFLLMRQLFPNPNFDGSISSFSSSECATKTISVNDSYHTQNQDKPVDYPKWCNPGPGTFTKEDDLTASNNNKTPLCDIYGFDPCCLSRDVLLHMKNYYPRCERVKICDIEKAGKAFWNKYLEKPLPYQYK